MPRPDPDLLYFVALMIPEPVASTLEQARKKIRGPEWSPTVGPHITLFAPGQAKAPAEEAAAMFSQLTLPIGPVTLRLGGPGSFSKNRLSTLYLRPRPTEPLIRLYQSLIREAPRWQDISRSEGRALTLHVTMTGRLPSQKADQVRAQLEEVTPALPQVTCRHITLMTKTAKERVWRELARCPLREPSSLIDP